VPARWLPELSPDQPVISPHPAIRTSKRNLWLPARTGNACQRQRHEPKACPPPRHRDHPPRTPPHDTADNTHPPAHRPGRTAPAARPRRHSSGPHPQGDSPADREFAAAHQLRADPADRAGRPSAGRASVRPRHPRAGPPQARRGLPSTCRRTIPATESTRGPTAGSRKPDYPAPDHRYSPRTTREHAASVQGRDAAKPLLWNPKKAFLLGQAN
jgi:hypothetical protein